jgi:hypothetical protein
MTHTVTLHTHGKIKLGVGTATQGSATITGFTNTAGNSAKYATVNAKRNVLVAPATGSSVSKMWNARVLTDNLAGTIVLTRTHPFAD